VQLFRMLSTTAEMAHPYDDDYHNFLIYTRIRVGVRGRANGSGPVLLFTQMA
jgi:hypothetical protein